MEDRIVPKIVQIEPIFGCNASCIMCPVNNRTTRKKGVISMDLFKKIVDDIAPYNDRIEQIDLFGLGEPILDPQIFEKVKYLKRKGLKGVGISTNIDLLDEKKQDELLESGLDTVIVSVDSLKKEIHEKIRVNTVFERVMANSNSLIQKRDAGNFKTKFVFRYIQQEVNKGEWEAYKTYWGERLDRMKGDQVNSYDVHNWVGEVDIDVGHPRAEDIEALECYQIFDRMFILSNGIMSMCSCDLHHPNVIIGDVTRANVIDVYNNEKMREVRELHLNGQKSKLKICRKCNMLYSQKAKKIFQSID